MKAKSNTSKRMALRDDLIHAVRLEDAKIAKVKRTLSKRLHDEGFRKMWVKVNTGKLGVSDIEIIVYGRKITYAGAQMACVTML